MSEALLQVKITWKETACLPVCVYNHKEWVRDFSGKPTQIFPSVVMFDPPHPYDSVPAEKRHSYSRVHREKTGKVLPRHAIAGSAQNDKSPE